MKTVVITFLSFFFVSILFAQNYAADEFIVEYVEGATDTDRQQVRNLFGITDVIYIDDGIELWSGIQFPLIVTEGDAITIIDDIDELLYYINIQEGDEEDDINALAVINNGDPNYLLTLVDDGTGMNATFDPLPFCDDQHNTRLIGPIVEEGEQVQAVQIIIVDQEISIGNDVITINFELDDDFVTGGNHGDKIYSIIKNQLNQAGIEDVIFYNIELFNNEGTSSYYRLLKTFGQLSQGDGPFPSWQKAIMNFSANMIVSEGDESLILWQMWEDFIVENEILLISSAGNQGSTSDNVFPAAANWLNEISVAGTQRCFYEPWEHTNSNPIDFDIAAEAQYVTVFDGQNFEIANGTSFSSAFVTGAAAQLAARCSTFDPIAIKNALLNYAEINPNMINVVNQGRTLDIESSIRNWDNCTKKRALQATESSPLTLTTTPNPFSTTALVTIDLPEAGDVTINMYNMMGQRVHEEFIPNQQELLEIEWPTPTKLARGTYMLRVQVGDAVEQMMMVKQ